MTHAYPTPQHALAAEDITQFFSRQTGVESVLLMGSCARGKAGPDSCLDILILCRPPFLDEHRPRLEGAWQQYYESSSVLQDLLRAGAYTHVDLDFVDGVFQQGHHGWTSGADSFELEIGNTLAYTVPLWEGGSYGQELRDRWLPYYDEALRQERLAMVLKYLHNNLDHIPLFAPRRLYFQCMKRFYLAFEEFLQALFISRRTYPIAYDKWVYEGVAEILELPELYARLPHLFEIQHFESQEIVGKAGELKELIKQYIS